MGRRNFNDGQEVKLADLNAITFGIERQLYERALYHMLRENTNRVFGDGFEVSFVDATTVEVAEGFGFQQDNSQSSPQSKIRPLFRAAAVEQEISPADLDDDRIDIICIKAEDAVELTEMRKFKNASTLVITNENMPIQRDWEAEILYVEGTADPTPSAPATPAGYIKIAEILVTAVTGISGSGAITDTRPLFDLVPGSTVNEPDPGDYPLSLTAAAKGSYIQIDSTESRSITMPPATDDMIVGFIDKDGLLDENPATLGTYDLGESFAGGGTTYEIAAAFGSWLFIAKDGVWRLI